MKKDMFFSEEELTAARQYWLEQLSGERDELDLQHGTKIVQESKKLHYTVNFTADLCEKILTICKDRDLLLYMLLAAVFKLLLFKYTGQDEIIIASPLYSTSDEYYDYNKCIPLIDGLDDSMSFRQLLEQVKNTVVEGYKNQHYSLEEILETPGVKNRRFNYLKVLVMLENIHKREPIEDIVDSPANEMTVSFVRNGNNLEGDIRYNALLFNEEMISDMCTSYLRIFAQVLSDRAIPLGEVLWVTEAEKRKLLYDFNDTAAAYPHTGTVVDLFQQQVEKSPDHMVLAFKDQQLTYSALNERANRAAHRLIEKGVQPGTFVGMMAIYSVEMIVGIMGILKSGAAYLPIDPGYPARRINYMLTDAGAGMLLTCVLPNMLDGVDFNGEIADLPDPGFYHSRTENPEILNTVDHLAYVIYTSGSTGKPKGVLVEHGSVVNYAAWKIRTYGFTPADKTLQLISLCFDGFGANLYPAVLSGGTLEIPDGSRYGDFKYINQVIRERKITHMSVVPIMYRACLENIDDIENIENSAHNPLKSLRMVALAGEKAAPELVELSLSRFKHITLINEYGPTEGTIAVASYQGVSGENTGIIGEPAANTRLFILNKNNQLQPIGIPGELCISGAGLARGYLNRPELTVDRFISGTISPGSPESPGSQSLQDVCLSYCPEDRVSKLYKTGDRARWLRNGTIELLGRIDQQVKIRGYRVEPQEIEAALSRTGSIKEVVVMDKKDAMGNNYLCAYFTATQEINISETREILAGTLPDYMVPSRFIRLETFPLTANGKLDRKALPEPEQVVDTGIEFVEPTSRIEKDLAGVWQRVLSVERVGINDNFFDLGGNSFLLMQINSEVEKIYPGCLTITDFFAYPTIAQLAGFVNKNRQKSMDSQHNTGSKNEIAIEIETLPFPGEYFHEEPVSSTHSSFDLKFEISGELLEKMKHLSQKESVELNQLLLAVYIYLFAEIIHQPRIVCQAACYRENRIIPVSLNLTDIKDFSEFFKLLVQLQKQNETGGYRLEDIGPGTIKKPANAIIPFFYRKELLTLSSKYNLPDIYDIVLEVEEETNRIGFVCEFNGQLREEKIEEMMDMYVRLSEFLIGQCLEKSEAEAG